MVAASAPAAAESAPGAAADAATPMQVEAEAAAAETKPAKEEAEAAEEEAAAPDTMKSEAAEKMKVRAGALCFTRRWGKGPLFYRTVLLSTQADSFGCCTMPHAATSSASPRWSVENAPRF